MALPGKEKRADKGTGYVILFIRTRTVRSVKALYSPCACLRWNSTVLLVFTASFG